MFFSHQFLTIPSRKICHVFPSIPHYPTPQDLSCSHQFLTIPSRKICHVPINSSLSHPARSVMFPSIPHYPIPQDLSCFPINSSLSHPARSVMFPSIPHHPIPQDLSCSHQFLTIPSRKICHVPINSSLSHPARSVMFPSIHHPIPQDLSCSHQFLTIPSRKICHVPISSEVTSFYYAPTYKGEVVKGGESSPPKPSTPPILDTSYKAAPKMSASFPSVPFLKPPMYPSSL
ncbi:hypothetical protein M8J75_015489 [Diaphorina citri]|nr:hypothetical protein M8J75_015489 [Diaphorina citri]